MPHAPFPVEGTPAEKLEDLYALTIQQQGYLNLLTVLVGDLYAKANDVAPDVAGPLLDRLLPKHIASAAEDFRRYGLQHQIAQIQTDHQ